MHRLALFVLVGVVSHTNALISSYPIIGRHFGMAVSAASRCKLLNTHMALSYGDKTGQLSPESKGNPDDKTGVNFFSLD